MGTHSTHVRTPPLFLRHDTCFLHNMDCFRLLHSRLTLNMPCGHVRQDVIAHDLDSDEAIKTLCTRHVTRELNVAAGMKSVSSLYDGIPVDMARHSIRL